MFENVKSSEELQKFITGNGGGNGVAVMLSGGIVQKYKVKSFYTVCTGDSFIVVGVELDAPKSVLMNITAAHGGLKNGDRYWVSPSVVYRNKGECARGNAWNRIHHYEDKIASKTEELKTLDSNRSAIESEMEDAARKKDGLLVEFRKNKWFR